MIILIVILFVLYFYNNRESFSIAKKKGPGYMILIRYNNLIGEVIKNIKKYLTNDIVVIVNNDEELKKVEQLGVSGEVIDEPNILVISKFISNKYDKAILYMDNNIELMNKNINDDIQQFIADKDRDIIFRCNANDFLSECDNDLSSSFMLMKKNKANIGEYDDLETFLKNNPEIKWNVFNSYQYPNNSRYYNNIRSVYYNNDPYIKNKNNT